MPPALRLPGARLLRTYRRDWWRGDVAAGFAVTALMIPHGMAYAELAGVPAVTGLYTTIAALFAYAAFGPSRVLLLGPDSSLAPLIAVAIAVVGSDGDPAQAIATASMLALMTGALCVLAGLSRLGSIAELLSRPVQLGYLNGLAIVMVISQLPKLSGFSVDGDLPVEQAREFASGVTDGLVNATALLLGVATLVVIVVLARASAAIPGVLVAVVGAILVVRVFDLVADGVEVVGALPTGFPTPRWPSIDVGSVPSLLLASVGLAWVTLSDTTALSRGFAVKTRERIDPNDEIVALGMSNLAAGAFQGFPVSASTSRTTIGLASGAQSQLVGVISAVLVLLLLIFGSSVVEFLPSTALAAIVIAAAIKLFDVGQLRWLASVRRSEFALAVASMVAVVGLGVLNGLAVAVALSLANFIRQVWRPYDAVLGRVEQRRGYHDVGRHPTARQVPGLVIFRFDAPLFFANADHFERRLRTIIRSADGPVRLVLIAAEPITDIDTSAAVMLEALVDDLHERGIELAFAELKGPVKDRLGRYGLYESIGPERFHPTIGSAVRSYVSAHDVDWVNWDDRV
ncbi:MAG: sulfate permease [Ilumatobacter sp.]|nr:sulfate permease [Ilumatobacter sp.]